MHDPAVNYTNDQLTFQIGEAEENTTAIFDIRHMFNRYDPKAFTIPATSTNPFPFTPKIKFVFFETVVNDYVRESRLDRVTIQRSYVHPLRTTAAVLSRIAEGLPFGLIGQEGSHNVIRAFGFVGPLLAHKIVRRDRLVHVVNLVLALQHALLQNRLFVGNHN